MRRWHQCGADGHAIEQIYAKLAQSTKCSIDPGEFHDSTVFARKNEMEELTRRKFLFAALGVPATSHGTAPIPLLTVSSDRMLSCGDLRIPCLVGYNGIRLHKHEGDGATPAGTFPLRKILFRPDRVSHVETSLPAEQIDRLDGWCTAPESNNYNKQIKLPTALSHEILWRNDELYDIVVVVGYNDAPAIPGHGSAIFLHCARSGMRATDGCIAVPRQQLIMVAACCGPSTGIEISGH